MLINQRYSSYSVVLTFVTGFLLACVFRSVPILDPSAHASEPQKNEGTLEVEKLVIKDKQGRRLAYLGPSEKPGEGVALKLFDAEQKDRVSIVLIPLNGYGPYLMLKDGQGKIRLGMEISPQGEPGIDLYNERGQSNVFIRACEGTGSGIFICQKGKFRAVLSGKAYEEADQKAAENGQLLLYDSDHHVISRLPNQK